MEGLFLLVHDVIKIMYTNEGYLPDYPYHLISDEEMFDAFLFGNINYFSANYPCPKGMDAQYSELVSAITFHITSYKLGQTSASVESTYVLPDWIYSYMLGAVVGPTSTEQDRHDLFMLLDMDNLEDQFTPEIYEAVYRRSQKWIYKLPTAEREHRPPTMFGEPHVIKSLRIDSL